MRVDRLADEWERSPEIRQRIMNGGSLLNPESGDGEDIKTCTKNTELLAPMLQRMAESPKCGHPPIDGLRLQVEQLFQQCHRHRVPVPEWDLMQKWAWRLRFLVCFIKMKARRGEVSVDTWVEF